MEFFYLNQFLNYPTKINTKHLKKRHHYLSLVFCTLYFSANCPYLTPIVEGNGKNYAKLLVRHCGFGAFLDFILLPNMRKISRMSKNKFFPLDRSLFSLKPEVFNQFSKKSTIKYLRL